MGTLLGDILGGFGEGLGAFLKAIILSFVNSIDYMIYKTTTGADGTVTVTKEYNTYVALLVLVLVVSFGTFLVRKFIVSPIKAVKHGR